MLDSKRLPVINTCDGPCLVVFWVISAFAVFSYTFFTLSMMRMVFKNRGGLNELVLRAAALIVTLPSLFQNLTSMQKPLSPIDIIYNLSNLIGTVRKTYQLEKNQSVMKTLLDRLKINLNTAVSACVSSRQIPGVKQ